MGWLSGYGSGAGYRKKLTIDHTVPTGTLSNFSKLFKITADADIGTHCDIAGNSLRVTAADGTTQLPFGILSFAISGGTATLAIRVNVTTIDNSTDKDVYLYYKPTGSNGEDKSGAMDANAVAYWPLEEDPSGSAPQNLDWSGNRNLTSGGSMNSGDSVAGKVAKGVEFDGVDDVLSSSNSLPFNYASSFSGRCIAYLNSTTGLSSTFISQSDSAANNYNGWAFVAFRRATLDSTSLTLFLISSTATKDIEINAGANAIAAGNWYHLAFTWTGVSPGNGLSQTYAQIFINGVRQTKTVVDDSFDSFNFNNTTSPVRIGKRNNDAPQVIDGIIDEVAMYSAVLSDEWIAYDYTDQFSNSSTFTKGSEEVETGGSSAISGSATLTFGAGTCTLSGAGTLAGSTPLTFGTGTSTLHGAGVLTGSSSLTLSTGTCTLTGSGLLAGTSSLTIGGTATPVGGLSPLVGTSALTLGASSTLLGAAPITGSAALLVGTSSTLSGSGTLTGSSAITISGSATLQAAGSATATLTLTASGTLLGAGALVGTSTLTLSGSAVITDLSILPYTTHRMIIDNASRRLVINNH